MSTKDDDTDACEVRMFGMPFDFVIKLAAVMSLSTVVALYFMTQGIPNQTQLILQQLGLSVLLIVAMVWFKRKQEKVLVDQRARQRR